MHVDNKTNVFNFIKERVTILQVVNEYVSLKKAGYYWKGCCLFHQEKTASFTVSPQKEIFYCFGCHEGGDIITFITKIEHCSTFEAVQHLADRYNINLPQEIKQSVNAAESGDKKKRYFELCQLVALWAQGQMKQYPFVEEYIEARGFSQKNRELFCIGYFPPSDKSIKLLVREIAKHNFLIKDLLDAHIVGETSHGLYSPFEDRLIFPIKDHLGRFCAFGGRTIKKEDTRPKYYNSKETPFFQKGSLLFNLDLAKKAIQKEGTVFLVEGYTDCMAMVQHGIENTVATLGTACTVEHLKLLSHHAQKVYLVYDGDQAGQNAMLRLAHMCWQVSLDLFVIFLPHNSDPASFLQNNGNFQILISESQDILTFFLNHLGKEFKDKSLQQKLIDVRAYLEIIDKIEDSLKQDLLLQKASLTFNMPFHSLRSEMDKIHKKTASLPEKKEENNGQEESLNQTLSSLEKKLIASLINDITLLEKEEVTRLVRFLPENAQIILAKLKAAYKDSLSNQFIHFFSTLDYDEQKVVNNLLLSHDEELEKNMDTFEQLLILLEKKFWKISLVRQKLIFLVPNKKQIHKKCKLL